VSSVAVQKEAIVAVALTLLRREGLEAVTFRKLMARLDIKAPAIYWRFDSKRDLLDAVAEALLQKEFSELRPFDAADGPWQDWLVGTLHRLRRALLAYPDGARVVAGARPHLAPTLARLADYALQALDHGGIDVPTAGAVIFTALHYTFGHVIEEQSSPPLAALAEAGAAPVVATYPAIARLISFARSKRHSPDDVYEVGLRLIVAGADSIGSSRFRDALSRSKSSKRSATAATPRPLKHTPQRAASGRPHKSRKSRR
jgi:AcrR family transcriptional regulator